MAAGDRRLAAAHGRGSRAPQAGLAASVLSSYGLLWLGTLLAAILAIPIAGPVREAFGLRLAPASAGTVSMAGLIAANNARQAALPLLFAALNLGGRRWLVLMGDVIVSASLAVNVARGGLALGAYGPDLLRFLPQWPVEWGGLAFGLTGWRRARRGHRDACELILLGVGAATLVCLAALLEAYAVPQR
jgi:hypothetical protein